MSFASHPLRISLSRRLISPVTFFICTYAKSKSISTLSNLNLATGTKASLTSVKSVTSLCFLRMGMRTPKKCSSRLMCLGATHKISISELGPLTPSLKEPNGKIAPPESQLSSSEHYLTQFTTISLSVARIFFFF